MSHRAGKTRAIVKTICQIVSWTIACKGPTTVPFKSPISSANGSSRHAEKTASPKAMGYRITARLVSTCSSWMRSLVRVGGQPEVSHLAPLSSRSPASLDCRRFADCAAKPGYDRLGREDQNERHACAYLASIARAAIRECDARLPRP